MPMKTLLEQPSRLYSSRHLSFITLDTNPVMEKFGIHINAHRQDGISHPVPPSRVPNKKRFPSEFLVSCMSGHAYTTAADNSNYKVFREFLSGRAGAAPKTWKIHQYSLIEACKLVAGDYSFPAPDNAKDMCSPKPQESKRNPM